MCNLPPVVHPMSACRKDSICDSRYAWDFNLPLIIIFLNTSGCSVTDVLLSAIFSLSTAMVFMFGIVRVSLKSIRNGIDQNGGRPWLQSKSGIIRLGIGNSLTLERKLILKEVAHHIYEFVAQLFQKHTNCIGKFVLKTAWRHCQVEVLNDVIVFKSKNTGQSS